MILNHISFREGESTKRLVFKHELESADDTRLAGDGKVDGESSKGFFNFL